jgi:hypothetical protein
MAPSPEDEQAERIARLRSAHERFLAERALRLRGRFRATRVTKDTRCCDGWPNIGECERAAKRGSRYCRSCGETAAAHGHRTGRQDED